MQQHQIDGRRKSCEEQRRPPHQHEFVECDPREDMRNQPQHVEEEGEFCMGRQRRGSRKGPPLALSRGPSTLRRASCNFQSSGGVVASDIASNTSGSDTSIDGGRHGPEISASSITETTSSKHLEDDATELPHQRPRLEPPVDWGHAIPVQPPAPPPRRLCIGNKLGEIVPYELPKAAPWRCPPKGQQLPVVTPAVRTTPPPPPPPPCTRAPSAPSGDVDSFRRESQQPKVEIPSPSSAIADVRRWQNDDGVDDDDPAAVLLSRMTTPPCDPPCGERDQGTLSEDPLSDHQPSERRLDQENALSSSTSSSLSGREQRKFSAGSTFGSSSSLIIKEGNMAAASGPDVPMSPMHSHAPSCSPKQSKAATSQKPQQQRGSLHARALQIWDQTQQQQWEEQEYKQSEEQEICLRLSQNPEDAPLTDRGDNSMARYGQFQDNSMEQQSRDKDEQSVDQGALSDAAREEESPDLSPSSEPPSPLPSKALYTSRVHRPVKVGGSMAMHSMALPTTTLRVSEPNIPASRGSPGQQRNDLHHPHHSHHPRLRHHRLTDVGRPTSPSALSIIAPGGGDLSKGAEGTADLSKMTATAVFPTSSSGVFTTLREYELSQRCDTTQSKLSSAGGSWSPGEQCGEIVGAMKVLNRFDLICLSGHVLKDLAFGPAFTPTRMSTSFSCARIQGWLRQLQQRHIILELYHFFLHGGAVLVVARLVADPPTSVGPLRTSQGVHRAAAAAASNGSRVCRL